ncbi:hypothetical protein RN607_02065 [Demequina capsici]|uniref:Uncharacterized protein n=1 Tax=Demequina capsici TaxID=3075620 RepID=A0AA96F822_9MICO|nr:MULTISPECIES: hypothetical protein [unclassified Demequina]WNM24908.1 hypothetical protein RN606_01790 [Demequina sp. OYTSA14]WNM27815.1 hypothetical protein RN607_02065 [Demequina sp. PMTSA13]
MFETITSAFSRKSAGANYANLPASVRDEIIDAMSATSKTDIR